MAQEDLNKLSYSIIGCAFKVHTQLGPGLLESAYEICLEHELGKVNIGVARQVPLPIIYDGIKLDAGYRIDLLVDEKVIIEIKSVDQLAPIHQAQLMTYLKLAEKKLGLLINFNVMDLKTGIKRIAM